MHFKPPVELPVGNIPKSYTGNRKFNLTFPVADAHMLDAIAVRLGVPRSNLVMAAIRQYVIRFLLNISDPALPLASVTFGRRFIPDPSEFTAWLEVYGQDDPALEIFRRRLAETNPVPSGDTRGDRGPRFDPDDPKTFHAVKRPTGGRKKVVAEDEGEDL
jgi:hypothetical protein